LLTSFAVASKGYYREAISTNPGVAIKVWATADTSKPDTELDYTLTPTGDYKGLYYSIGGAGNSSPFTSSGYGVIPSSKSLFSLLNCSRTWLTL